MNLSAEVNPTGDHDKDKYDSLDQAKDVHESDTETRGKGMYARNDNNNRKCDPPFSPFGRHMIRRNKIFSAKMTQLDAITFGQSQSLCCHAKPEISIYGILFSP